jgi:hypothetical protein
VASREDTTSAGQQQRIKLSKSGTPRNPQLFQDAGFHREEFPAQLAWFHPYQLRYFTMKDDDAAGSIHEADGSKGVFQSVGGSSRLERTEGKVD